MNHAKPLPFLRRQPARASYSGVSVVNRETLVERLEQIVGKDGVFTRPADLLVYEYDGSVDGAVNRPTMAPHFGPRPDATGHRRRPKQGRKR